MGIIQNIIRKLGEKKAEKKHMEEVQRWQEQIETRKLNSNERELLKFKEEERQIKIKQMLDGYRKRERKELWSGKKFNPIYAPNIMKDNKNLFKNNNLFLRRAS